MNTRLQVEHCVSEMITGIDLVKEQIKVARGEKLSFTQEDLSIKGHAIELRVCAEDPTNNFMPDTGMLQVYRRPQGAGIRVDDGYEEGMLIPVYYDSMIGKLIAWGTDRKDAIARLSRAIDEFRINGIETTLPFGKWAIHHESFVSGTFDTHFIENYFKPEYLNTLTEEEKTIAAEIATAVYIQKTAVAKPINGSQSKWRMRRFA
jgi:Acetyl/propionyl-CoA carboxylase, alpha subunit